MGGEHVKLYILFVFGLLGVGILGQNCHLDDAQGTKGSCTSIEKCRYALGQLYSRGPEGVKRCSKLNKLVCCPTEPTLSEKKCAEYVEILKSPETFGQSRFSSPRCAFQGNSAFIVGGRDANEFEFPHAVGLGYGQNPDKLEYLCGATLISESYLLTAAHCLTNSKHGRPHYAVIGDVTLKSQTSAYRKKVLIVDWITHPKYSPPQIYNDIALLKLKEPLELSRYLLPACLGTPTNTPKNNGQVQAIGWGQTGFGESQARHLQAVNLSVVSTKKCNESFSGGGTSYRYPEGVLRSQLCAGDTHEGEGKDTCNGDSGGGLSINPEHRCLFHVVGITSLGSKFCGYGEPAIYTKVSSYIDWIERVVWSR